MVFSSFLFIFVFLPITCIVYFVIPSKVRNCWLLLASLIFYSWNNISYTLILICSIALNWFVAIVLIQKNNYLYKRIILVIGIVANLGLLSYFKYSNFIVGNVSIIFPNISDNWTDIVLPLGISFFTFQGLSYIVDVYRGDVKPQYNPMYVGLYIALFPQLVAGPIVRYTSFESNIRSRSVSIEQVGNGFSRFVIGLSKKVILADTFGRMADEIVSKPDTWIWGNSWIGIIAYTLQIYYDFSGYSDMAIGLAGIFGFSLPENFNYPYVSKSITEFWRRWHISLSSWFRDYVYIPCGGSRVTRSRTIFNIMLVWCLTGMWHGANWTFMCWGLYYGALLVIEKYIVGDRINKIPGIVRWFVTMLLIMFGWVFFRMDSVSQAIEYFKRMMMIANVHESLIAVARNLINYKWFWIIGLVGLFPIKNTIKKYVGSLQPIVASSIEGAYIIVLFVVSTIFCISSSYNAFIYFQF